MVRVQPLPGGLRNSNFRVDLEPRTEPVVLRIYECDPTACQKEVDLHRLIRETVPVPEILHVQPAGMDGTGPFVLMRYVDGITFRQLKESRDTEAIGQAASSIGAVLAAIGRYTFSEQGRLGPGPAVTGHFVEGPNPILRFLDSCLASSNLQKGMDDLLREKVHTFAWSWAPHLAFLDEEKCLVHCDFNSPNLLVKTVDGRWAVAAVIDWEFAISGPPLFDIGNFLRYERTFRPLREPHFSLGYTEGGGRLPDGWRRLARVIDLTSLCEILTREQVPEAVVNEVLDLSCATDEDRDPR